MATATINGITFECSLSEMMALANSITAKVDIAPVDNSHVEKVVAKVSEKRESNSTHTYECGHTLPASRGRYSALCPNCKGSGAPTSEKRTEKREAAPDSTTKRSENGKAREITIKNPDMPMSPSQRWRIRKEFERINAPKRTRNSAEARFETMTKGQAHDLISNLIKL